MPQISLHSPIGPITLSEEEGALVALDWGWGRDQAHSPLLDRAAARLQAYFDGATDGFEDLPLRPQGSAFCQAVWQALVRIPRGAVRSYADIAREAGGGPRAVGQANRRNPIPILIPCHRVVGSAGLGGYSGDGGIETKRFLLRLEGARA